MNKQEFLKRIEKCEEWFNTHGYRDPKEPLRKNCSEPEGVCVALRYEVSNHARDKFILTFQPTQEERQSFNLGYWLQKYNEPERDTLNRRLFALHIFKEYCLESKCYRGF